jgi:hypothetical protein
MRASERLVERAPTLSPSIVRMTRFVFEELGANVVQHSRRPDTGFGFAEARPELSRLQIAFANRGVGFRTSLSANPELQGRLDDDGMAIQLAVTPRISGSSDPRSNMGLGLKMLVDFSDALGADLYIASGEALLRRRTLGGEREDVVTTIPRWQGSWICLDAPLTGAA